MRGAAATAAAASASASASAPQTRAPDGSAAAAATALACELDEERLLEETETLLSSLHPIAFLDGAVTPRRALSPPSSPLAKTSPPSSPASSVSTITSSNDSSNDGSISDAAPIPTSAMKHQRQQLKQEPRQQQQRSPTQPEPEPEPVRRGRPGPTAKPGAKRNASRERLQRELGDLREQAAQLEQQLVATRHAQRAVLPLRAWKGIAKRQRDQRERAETETKRLKARIEMQDAFVVEMLYRWKRSMASPPSPLESDGGGVLTVQPGLRFDPGDSATLEQFVSELDSVYWRTQSVFQDAGVSETHATSFIRISDKTLPPTPDGRSRSVVEAVVVDVSPFDFAVQKRVGWQCMKRFQLSRDETIRYPLPRRSARSAHFDDSSDDDDDTFAVKQRVTRVHDEARSVIYYLFTMRRYCTTAQHEVWIWRGVTKSAQYMTELCVEETGWIVSSDLAAGAPLIAGTPPLVGTVQRTCAHYETKALDGGTLERIKPVAEMLTSLVVNADEDVSAELSAMVESMVLDSSAAASRRQPSERQAGA